MFTVPKPYPKEFRDDVVNVARNREPGQHLKQIAADFGISESCLTNWMKAADVEEGSSPGRLPLRTRTCVRPASGSGCWSRRTKCCVARRPICRRRTCRENALPARP
jgi:transposase-like protein